MEPRPINGLCLIRVYKSGSVLTVNIDARACHDNVPNAIRYLSSRIDKYNHFLNEFFRCIEAVMDVTFITREVEVFTGLIYEREGNIFIGRSSSIEYLNDENQLDSIKIIQIDFKDEQKAKIAASLFDSAKTSELWVELWPCKEAKYLFDLTHTK